MLSDKDINDIKSNMFTVELMKVSLVQQLDSAPKLYSGSGSVALDEKGKLQLKIYCQLQDEDVKNGLSDMLDTSTLIPGQIIAENEFYSLTAIDIKGHEWIASDLWLNKKFSFPTSSCIIYSDVRSIESSVERTVTAIKFVKKKISLVQGKFSFPYNRVNPNSPELGPSICDLDLGDERKCRIENQGDSILIFTELPEEREVEYNQIVMEALSISVGQYLRPKLEITSTENASHRKLNRQEDSSTPPSLNSPFSMKYSRDAVTFQTFVQCYVKTIHEPSSSIAGFWFRALTAAHSGLENQALAITTGIEGLLKQYFDDDGKPDQEFIDQTAAAAKIIKTLNLGERTENRITSTLSSAKNHTPANALFSLVSKKKIPKELRSTWKVLRNKVAHANELEMSDEKIQTFLNDLHSCLELFYRLVMLHIEYAGPIVAYRKRSWPDEKLFDFVNE